jgi:hypothetical protein
LTILFEFQQKFFLRTSLGDVPLLIGNMMSFRPWHCLTMDKDLLKEIDNRLDTITVTMKEACLMQVEEDGISFDAEAVEAVRITEDAEYEGVRIRFHGSLGNARVSIQFDIGYGRLLLF